MLRIPLKLQFKNGENFLIYADAADRQNRRHGITQTVDGVAQPFGNSYVRPLTRTLTQKIEVYHFMHDKHNHDLTDINIT